MNAFCGWFDWSAAEAANRRPVATLGGLPTSAHSSGMTTEWRHALVTCTDNGVFRDSDRWVAVCGNVRFTDARLEHAARERGVAQALAQGHASAGNKILEKLSGTFALAILGRGGDALLAVDRTGIQSLYYTVQADRLVFGTQLRDMVGLLSTEAKLSRQAIYEYLYFHTVPGPRTIYEGCERLLPGTFLACRGGQVNLARYWRMEFREDARRPFPELKQEFRALLRDSVGKAMQDGGTTGAFLSGGTDSSTVAGMMREVTGQPPRTYSIGFDAPGYDEMTYARIAARHFPTQHHEYYITPQDVVDAIPLIAEAHDQPFGNSSAVPTYYCAKLAKADGVKTMLGGDGGDEIFGGNDRYAKQYIYSLYSDLPRVVRKSLAEPVVSRLPGRIALFAKAQRYIRNASQDMPARYDNHNLLHHIGAATVFTPEFLEAVDLTAPAAQMSEVYWGQRAHSMVNRMLGFDAKYTLADNDLPKVMRSCKLAGVDVRFPMLADEVVAFALRLPPELKLKRMRLRYFFKEALRGFLPDEIITKTKHGFGLPFGLWLMEFEPLTQIAFDSLMDLKRRGIVRAQFIDELCSTMVRAHPQYYGTMVWLLMMLERWIRRSGAGSFATSTRHGITEQAA